MHILKVWKGILTTFVAVKAYTSSHGVDYCLWLLKDLLLHIGIEVACKGDEQICVRSWEMEGLCILTSRGRKCDLCKIRIWFATTNTACVQVPNIIIIKKYWMLCSKTSWPFMICCSSICKVWIALIGSSPACRLTLWIERVPLVTTAMSSSSMYSTLLVCSMMALWEDETQTCI